MVADEPHTFAEIGGPSGPRRLASWAGVAAGGAGVGLLLGGVLTDALSWEWVFLINVPVGIATFALTLRIVPESRVVGRRGFDGLYLTQLDPGSAYLAAVVPGFIGMGFGVGNLWLPMTMAATGNVDAEHQGLASGLVNTSQQIGGALGLAVMSTLATDRAGDVLAGAADPASAAARADASVEGFPLGFGVSAGLMALAFAVMLLWLRRDDVRVTEAATVLSPRGQDAAAAG